ncbi:MAG: hypothetical protein R6X32_03405 [Chloroflexota bacterium]
MRLNHPDFLACLLLTGYTVLAHGLLLLYDGIYNDGWLYYTYMSEARWDLLGDLFLKQGIPHTIYLYRLLALFPNFLLAHKLFAFGSLLAIGWLLYGITQKLGWFTRGESLLLALWSVGFPAYQYAQEISHSWNLLPYPLFLLGWWLALHLVEPPHNSTHATRRTGLRLGALVCLALSFTNPALLVFYFGFWLVWIGRIYIQHPTNLFSIVGRTPDFLLLPFLYWGLMRLFFPPHGLFADYNEISLANLLNINAWWQFTNLGVVGQLARLFELIPVPLLLLAAAIYLLLNHRWHWEQLTFFQEGIPGRDTAVFLTGLLLLILTAFPFVAVDKLPTLYAFDSRLTLLAGLPVALLLLVGLRLLFGGNGGRLHRAGGLFALLLLLGFALAHMESYFAWQARWVRDQSVRLNLADLPLQPDQSIIYFADETVLYRRDGRIDEVSQAVSHRYFPDWTIMLRQVYGPVPGRLGMDVVYLEPTHHYYHWLMGLRERTLDPGEDVLFLAQIDPAGCQAIITIRPTAYAQQMSKLGLARRYWQHRFWQPAAQEAFLRSLTYLSLEPLDAPQAVNCR